MNTACTTRKRSSSTGGREGVVAFLIDETRVLIPCGRWDDMSTMMLLDWTTSRSSLTVPIFRYVFTTVVIWISIWLLNKKRFTITTTMILEKCFLLVLLLLLLFIEKALFLTWAALYYKQCKGNILESEGTV